MKKIVISYLKNMVFTLIILLFGISVQAAVISEAQKQHNKERDEKVLGIFIAQTLPILRATDLRFQQVENLIKQHISVSDLQKLITSYLYKYIPDEVAIQQVIKREDSEGRISHHTRIVAMPLLYMDIGHEQISFGALRHLIKHTTGVPELLQHNIYDNIIIDEGPDHLGYPDNDLISLGEISRHPIKVMLR